MDFIRIQIPAIANIVENKSCLFCVEDPFEMELNVARNVTTPVLRHIRCEMKRGFSVLKR